MSRRLTITEADFDSQAVNYGFNAPDVTNETFEVKGFAGAPGSDEQYVTFKCGPAIWTMGLGYVKERVSALGANKFFINDNGTIRIDTNGLKMTTSNGDLEINVV